VATSTDYESLIIIIATLVFTIFPSSVMDKHYKVTVTSLVGSCYNLLLVLPQVKHHPQEHSVFTHTLSHTLLINCITTSLGGHQH
jgi:hypothetical protein